MSLLASLAYLMCIAPARVGTATFQNPACVQAGLSAHDRERCSDFGRSTVSPLAVTFSDGPAARRHLRVRQHSGREGWPPLTLTVEPSHLVSRAVGRGMGPGPAQPLVRAFQ